MSALVSGSVLQSAKARAELGTTSDEVGNVETGAPAYLRSAYRRALAQAERGTEQS